MKVGKVGWGLHDVIRIVKDTHYPWKVTLTWRSNGYLHCSEFYGNSWGM